MFHILPMKRSQYLNAVNCFEELLDMGVVPVVNENDTICSSVCFIFLVTLKVFDGISMC